MTPCRGKVPGADFHEPSRAEERHRHVGAWASARSRASWVSRFACFRLAHDGREADHPLGSRPDSMAARRAAMTALASGKPGAGSKRAIAKRGPESLPT